MTEVLGRLFSLLCAIFLTGAAVAAEKVAIAYPGPHNIPFLPIDLASKIGADKAEGIEFVPLYASGAIAMQHLQDRNADFAIPGAPAAMSARAAGIDVVLVAPINDLPVYALTVRNDLKGKVRHPRDLAGRPVGVTSSSLTVKTTSHQVAEFLLKHDGVPASQLRLVAVGHTWEEISAMVQNGAVDALLSFEPFPSRLQSDGLMYPVFNMAEPMDAKRISGAGFLLAALATRSDIVTGAPRKVEAVVAALRRALQWIAAHKPEEIVDALQIADAEKRASLLASLLRYPRLYSTDGKFSQRQMRETEIFFAAINNRSQRLSIDDMVDARWAGRKP